MTFRAAFIVAAGLAAALGPARAQPAPPVLQPLSAASIAGALARPVGEPVRAPRTSGAVDLRGKRVYIAEYLLLVDLSGELPAWPQDGRLLGRAVGDGPVTLAYRTQPDIAALQALTDRAWADLQARLATAGVVLADAAAMVRAHGAVYDATEPASLPGAPRVLEAKVGETTRRYLALAPTGMRLVPRSAAGIGVGNIAARVAYPAQGIEALSLAMAINLSALDPAGRRTSTWAAADGAPALSPLMELGPAPSAALVHAHAQLALVNLDEALQLAGEFGRLRPAASPAADSAPRDPLAPLLSLGRRLLGDAGTPRVDALLETDGPTTARLMLYATSAANQAVANALKAAQQPAR